MQDPSPGHRCRGSLGGAGVGCVGFVGPGVRRLVALSRTGDRQSRPRRQVPQARDAAHARCFDFSGCENASRFAVGCGSSQALSLFPRGGLHQAFAERPAPASRREPQAYHALVAPSKPRVPLRPEASCQARSRFTPRLAANPHDALCGCSTQASRGGDFALRYAPCPFATLSRCVSEVDVAQASHSPRSPCCDPGPGQQHPRVFGDEPSTRGDPPAGAPARAGGLARTTRSPRKDQRENRAHGHRSDS